MPLTVVFKTPTDNHAPLWLLSEVVIEHHRPKIRRAAVSGLQRCDERVPATRAHRSQSGKMALGSRRAGQQLCTCRDQRQWKTVKGQCAR